MRVTDAARARLVGTPKLVSGVSSVFIPCGTSGSVWSPDVWAVRTDSKSVAEVGRDGLFVTPVVLSASVATWPTGERAWCECCDRRFYRRRLGVTRAPGLVTCL